MGKTDRRHKAPETPAPHKRIRTSYLEDDGKNSSKPKKSDKKKKKEKKRSKKAGGGKSTEKKKRLKTGAGPKPAAAPTTTSTSALLLAAKLKPKTSHQLQIENQISSLPVTEALADSKKTTVTLKKSDLNLTGSNFSKDGYLRLTLNMSGITFLMSYRNEENKRAKAAKKLAERLLRLGNLGFKTLCERLLLAFRPINHIRASHIYFQVILVQPVNCGWPSTLSFEKSKMSESDFTKLIYSDKPIYEWLAHTTARMRTKSYSLLDQVRKPTTDDPSTTRTKINLFPDYDADILYNLQDFYDKDLAELLAQLFSQLEEKDFKSLIRFLKTNLMLTQWKKHTPAILLYEIYQKIYNKLLLSFNQSEFLNLIEKVLKVLKGTKEQPQLSFIERSIIKNGTTWRSQLDDTWGNAAIQNDAHWHYLLCQQIRNNLNDETLFTRHELKAKRDDLSAQICAEEERLTSRLLRHVTVTLSTKKISDFKNKSLEEKLKILRELIETAYTKAKEQAPYAEVVITGHELLLSAGEYPIDAMSEKEYYTFIQSLEAHEDLLLLLPFNVVSTQTFDETTKEKLLKNAEKCAALNEDNDGYKAFKEKIEETPTISQEVKVLNSRIARITSEGIKEQYKTTPFYEDCNIATIDGTPPKEGSTVLYDMGEGLENHYFIWHGKQYSALQCLEYKMGVSKDKRVDHCLLLSATIDMTKHGLPSVERLKSITQADSVHDTVIGISNELEHEQACFALEDESFKLVKPTRVFDDPSAEVATLKRPWVLWVLRVLNTLFHEGFAKTKAFADGSLKGKARNLFLNKDRKLLEKFWKQGFATLLILLDQYPEDILQIKKEYPTLWQQLLTIMNENWELPFNEAIKTFKMTARGLKGQFSEKTIDITNLQCLYEHCKSSINAANTGEKIKLNADITKLIDEVLPLKSLKRTRTLSVKPIPKPQNSKGKALPLTHRESTQKKFSVVTRIPFFERELKNSEQLTDEEKITAKNFKKIDPKATKSSDKLTIFFSPKEHKYKQHCYFKKQLELLRDHVLPFLEYHANLKEKGLKNQFGSHQKEFESMLKILRKTWRPLSDQTEESLTLLHACYQYINSIAEKLDQSGWGRELLENLEFIKEISGVEFDLLKDSLPSRMSRS